ncbi:hypothetical protein HAX54_021949 [Datura stramonium]|uniref:Uncharacterized protein n=1 Tax=Datura stramonium TaxID=4076 RepID=A0ABS8UUA4_DATST|nr:hypothetical protein [Datura stramonium]
MKNLMRTVKTLSAKLSEALVKIREKEDLNSILKLGLFPYPRLKQMTSERDLSTHAAQTASKQQLESIKKVAKLEAECRMLKAFVPKRSAVNDHKSSAAYSAYHSLSNTGERLSSVKNDSCNMGCMEPCNNYQNGSGFLSSALVSELSQYKYGKPHKRDLIASSLEINLMDDFLEMEKLTLES